MKRLFNLTKLKLRVNSWLRPIESAETINEQRQSVVNLILRLPKLIRFDLHCLSLTHGNVFDIIRFAANLKTLHLHRCDIAAEEAIISTIVDDMAINHQPEQQPFELFIDENEQNNLNVVNNVETKRYLRIRWDCSHHIDEF